MKQILILLIVLCCAINTTATSELINESLYIYDESNVECRMYVYGDDLDKGANVNTVQCVDCMCSKMNVWIATNEDFSYDYELNYAPSETEYFTSIITIEQETYDSSLFGMYRKIYRTLSVDGIQLLEQNMTAIVNMGTTTHFAFSSLDKTVTLGSTTKNNVTMFFDTLICYDQYNDVYNGTKSVTMKFETVGSEGHSQNKLGGFTSIFLSTIGKIPFVGKLLYNVLYPPMLLIQYSLNFVFTFLNLIIYDWWYAILLLECICMIKALSSNGYADVMHVYINTHVQISMFVYHKLILPTINLIVLILTTAKDMIKWW